ncbi:hypothetical protein SS50377_25859 [Spironucleus salmonicida]|uniref:Uncharacterized protein n=1 Tax=Spironucleus salmonicida TaxID=348837 RepID=A0A9P8RW90_9EUKA|nr:hypothetical protein SS50377_25859 [Spironucleus salmonicida]
MMLSRSAKLKMLQDPKTPKNIDDAFRYDVFRGIQMEETYTPYVLMHSPYSRRAAVSFDYDVQHLFRKYQPSTRGFRGKTRTQPVTY